MRNLHKSKWFHKAEEIIDKLIPPALLVLAIVIVAEIFFQEWAHHHHTAIITADYIVITIFVVDLILKWIRIHKVNKFLKTCWLDILAVFPFATFFRAMESIFVFSLGIKELIGKGQSILHEGVEIEKEVARIMREVESTGKISRLRVLFRSARFTRLLRIFSRVPRFVKAFAFYERPYHAKSRYRKRKHMAKKGNTKS